MKTVISSNDRSFIDLAELKRFGGLLRYLSLRDVFVRYKQTRMGFAWSIIRPVINVTIFGCLSYLIDRTQDFSTRFLEVSAGIVFWQLLSTTIGDVSNSLSSNSNILSKVYFPKLILPLSSILVCLIDFLVAFILFFILFLVLRGVPEWQIFFLPVIIAYGLVFSFSLGLMAATASVRFRDVKFILPFLVQILFYASPVFLSSSFFLSLDLPSWIKVLYQLNPLVLMINGFKFCFFGQLQFLDPLYASISILITLSMLLFSVRYFLNFEKSFADYI